MDVDLFSGFDIGDLLGEDVCSFLSHQRGDVPLSSSRRVNLFCFFSFTNDASDFSFADGHYEFIDGRVLR